MCKQKNPKESLSSSSISNKLIEKWKQRKRRMHRQIECIRLKRIRRNTVPQYTYCKNCGTRLEGMYCYQCGQYALDTRQPFWKYIKQYFENVYQYDSKMWRTVWLMFTRPGFLTSEFNAGKINSYVHPFRLYMCISVVFFTIFFMLTSDKLAHTLLRTNAPDFSEQVLKQLKSGVTLPDTTVFAYHGAELLEVLKSKGINHADRLVQVSPFNTNEHTLSKVRMPRILFDNYYHSTQLRNAEQEDISELLQSFSITDSISRKNKYLNHLQTDSLLSWMDKDEQTAFKTFDLLNNFSLDNSNQLHVRVPIYDWNTNNSNQLRRESFLNQTLGELSKWTPFYMMFLLPVLALFFKLAYRKEHIPYMWHFVHAIHIHTVFLFLLPIPLFPVFLAEYPESTLSLTFQLLLAFGTGLFVYTYISQHTVYQNGWIKTLFKSLIIYIAFSILAIGIAAALLIWLLYTIGDNML